MASINGITVKSLKRTFGHEGEVLYSGDIYLGTKKLGSWSQDSWGVPDMIHLDKAYSQEKLNAAIAKANPEKAVSGTSRNGAKYEIPYDIELLMADLVMLKSDEKDFNAALRDGYYGVLIYTDGYHCNYWHLPKKYTECSLEQLKKILAGQIERVKKEFFKERPGHEHFFKIYRSRDDFSLGIKITLKEVSA